MSLIAHIQRAMYTDDWDTQRQSRELASTHVEATAEQRQVIDQVFIDMCGRPEARQERTRAINAPNV